MVIMQQCHVCKKEKPQSSFAIFRGKPNVSCEDCRAKHNRYYAENWHGRREDYKKRYQASKESHKARGWKNHLKRKYGLTIETYNSMVEQYGNVCPICKESKPRLMVDHCHKTGMVRGMLCRKCNLKLVVVEDTEFVQKAIDYLHKTMK